MIAIVKHLGLPLGKYGLIYKGDFERQSLKEDYAATNFFIRIS